MDKGLAAESNCRNCGNAAILRFCGNAAILRFAAMQQFNCGNAAMRQFNCGNFKVGLL